MRLIALGMFVCLFAGCAGSARYVVKNSTDGVVAIPDSSNHWPYRYHDRAIELIKEHVGPDFEILKEEEVVVGQAITNDQNVDTETRPSIVPWNQSQIQRVQSTETTRDVTELRITYRKRLSNTLPSNTMPLGN